MKVKVTRTSNLSGVKRTRTYDMTADQLYRLEAGIETIQEIFPCIAKAIGSS